MDTVLTYSWSVSRARDTYGYNICRLRDETTGKRYRCNGGGYDMQGTVFADWLEEAYQDRLLDIADRAYAVGNSASDWKYGPDGLYGMAHYRYGNGRRGLVRLDGACGLESIRRIAEAIGLKVEAHYTSRGRLQFLQVADLEGQL